MIMSTETSSTAGTCPCTADYPREYRQTFPVCSPSRSQSRATKLKDARKGDVLLVESIDRLSRLPVDWQKLKATIDAKGLRVVAIDLPTSHQGMRDTKGDEFTDRMLGAINSMLVEMMAAIARKDYEQRRERQAQGIEKAKAAGKYQGRQVDADLHKRVR